MKNVVIVSAKRTPIGSFMGSLSTVPAIDLGAVAIKAALEAVSLDPGLVDEVLMGQVLQAGCGQAPARQTALKAGIPTNIPCTTINKVCASGMKSIQLAAQSIAIGQIEIAVAGGMENMSLSPHFVSLRKGTAFGSQVFEDSLERDGLMNASDQLPMGVFADATAVKYGISRQEQDEYALHSYQRSAAAWELGLFDSEVVPVSVSQIGSFRDELARQKSQPFNPAFCDGQKGGQWSPLRIFQHMHEIESIKIEIIFSRQVQKPHHLHCKFQQLHSFQIVGVCESA